MADLGEILKAVKNSGVNVQPYGGGSGAAEYTNKAPAPKPVARSTGFLGKVGDIGKEAFHIGESGVEKAGSFVKNTGVNLYQEAEGSTVNMAKQAFNVQNISKNQKQLSNKQDQLIRDYAAGKVSKQDYIAKLNAITGEAQDLSKQAQKISQDKSALQRGLDVVDLGTSVLSGGSLKLASIAGKQELKTLVTKGTEDVFNANASQLEKAVARLPAVRDIFKRDILTSAKQLPGEAPNSFLTRNAKQIAVGLMLKRPIFYQTNIGLVQDAYKQMLDGKNGKAAQDAAWVAVQAVSGGPLGWFFRQSGRIGSSVKTLALGKGSFIDELSKLHGDYSPAQISNYLGKLKDESKITRIEVNKPNVPEVGTLYHGTKGSVDSIDKLDSLTHGDPNALYGPGTYLTDNPKVATGYSKTKGVGESKVLTGKLAPGTKLLNLENKLSLEEARVFDKYIDPPTRISAGGKTVEIPGETTAHTLTGKEAIKAVQERLESNDLSKAWGNDELLSLQEDLSKLGYKGFAHVGGVGKGEPHNVTILFNHGDEAKLPLTSTGLYKEVTQPTQAAKAGPTFAEAEKTMRIMQEVNLRAADDDPTHAAEAVMNHYYAHGINPTELTSAQLIDDMGKWAEGDAIAQKLTKQLKSDKQLVAVRWDTKAKNAVADAVFKAGNDVQARLAAVQQLADAPATGWGNNRILMTKLEQAIQEPTAKEASDAIKGIETASTLAKDIPAKDAKRLSELGYSVAEPYHGRETPTVAYEDTRKLVSAVTHGDKELFDESVAPVPVLSSIAYGLRKAGFTPETNNKVAFGKLSESLVDNLEEAGVANQIGLDGPDKLTGGKVMLSRLEEYITQQKPNRYLNALTGFKSQQSALQDIRQMNVDEIMQALPGTSRLQAKAIGDAVIDAYTKVPLEFRGLGVKAADYTFKIPGFKTYNRIQSALRYTYNPFFRAQEVVETKTLSHLKANNLVWQQPKAELDRVATLLDDSKIFSNSYTGEATQDLSIGRIHPNLVKTQRRDLSGLALDIASKRGISIEDMITDHPDELADALKVIVQYPSKGALNSPLARTLNVAFFPMRYNLKVAALAAGEIAKLPPTVQTAVIHSYLKFNDFLKSNEGIQWQADNADVIQLFGYFSVTGNINTVYKLLTNHQVNAVGDLGALGGLPFGFISQILDSEGIINLNTPYVDPKTGSVLPDYVPDTAKGKAATALQGLLNTMFTYPGRIIGAPGKAEELRKLTGVVVPTEGNDYTKVDRTADLTPLQQRMRQVLKDPTQDNVDSLYTAPAPGMFNWYTIPPKFVVPDTVDVLSKTEVAARKAAAKSAKAPKAKNKALPIPAQGQSLQV